MGYGKSCKEHVIYNSKGRGSGWSGVGPEVGNVFNVYERIRFALTEFHLNLMSPKMREGRGAGRRRETERGSEWEGDRERERRS